MKLIILFLKVPLPTMELVLEIPDGKMIAIGALVQKEKVFVLRWHVGKVCI